MNRADFKRVREIVAGNDTQTALALLELEFAPKPKHRLAKIPRERLHEMTERTIAWYAENGGARKAIAFNAEDEHGNDIARNDDERRTLARHLKHDPECQRRLHEIDGNGRC